MQPAADLNCKTISLKSHYQFTIAKKFNLTPYLYLLKETPFPCLNQQIRYASHRTIVLFNLWQYSTLWFRGGGGGGSRWYWMKTGPLICDT